MSLKAKYSPPFPVKIFDEQTITFRRMLMDDWEELTEAIRRDRVDAEATAINKEMAKEPADVRSDARTRMRDYFETSITLSSVMRECSVTPKGIKRLLSFSLIEKDKSEYLELISPADTREIIEQIVYMPVVKPDPQELPSSSEASGVGSAQNEVNPSGTSTPQTFDPNSESTPAS